MRLALFALLLSFHSMAQHSAQPEKESTSDLRAGTIIFKLTEVASEKMYWLERTVNMDYLLKMKGDGKDEIIRKISGREAQKIDRDFAARFIKVQYEIQPIEGDCKVTLRLSMKGEEQEICAKDDKKTQEFHSFLQELVKRF